MAQTRGRIWLANHPSNVMCLESAGGGLRVYSGGKWLAAMTQSEIANVDEQRRVLAGLTWDPRYGDRHTSLVAPACGARSEDIRRALEAALLTDAEMADPGQWHHYADPFGDWHEDPCVDSPNTEMHTPNIERRDER